MICTIPKYIVLKRFYRIQKKKERRKSFVLNKLIYDETYFLNEFLCARRIKRQLLIKKWEKNLYLQWQKKEVWKLFFLIFKNMGFFF